MKMVFSVPDMSCGHCKNRIEETLREETGIDSFDVDLNGKRVEVDTGLEADRIIELLDDAGYDAELI